MTRAGYNGVALTLIDSLDTLAVLGNASEFARGVRWVGGHVSFDLDIDVRSACNPPATRLRQARLLSRRSGRLIAQGVHPSFLDLTLSLTPFLTRECAPTSSTCSSDRTRSSPSSRRR